MISFFVCLLGISQASPPFFQDLENFQKQSLSLQTEKQNLEATSANLLSRRLFWTPKLSLSAVKTRSELNGTATTDTDYAEAAARLNLFRGGSDWDKMQGASAAQKAQELQVLNESLRVEISASDLIFKSLYLAETRRIQEGLFKLKEETLKIAKDRYQQGKLPLQEVTKSEVDLIQQKNRVRQAHLEWLENKSQITSSFVADIQTKAWPFTENLQPKIGNTQKFPLIEQKYWQSRRQEELYQSARGGHWPSLYLTVQYQQFPLRERTDKQVVGLLQLTIPIWSQYETSAEIASNYAQYIGALNEYKSTEQTLKQKSLLLKEKIEIAKSNLAEAKKNLDKSKGLYLDVLRSFRLGRISTNDLLIEQNRLFDSENSLALSQLSFHQTLIETCALAGISSAACLQ